MCYASCTQVKPNLTYQNNEENVFTFKFINTKKKKKILKTDLNIGEKKKKIFILRYGLGAYTCTDTFSFFCKIPKLFN